VHRRRHGRGRPLRDLSLTATFTLRAGGADDVAACTAIEIAAAAKFRAVGMDDLVAITAGDAYMAGHGVGHAADGSLIVAETADGLAGYIAKSVVDGLAHVCEIDVDPRFGGRNIGRALMEAAEEWARGRGLQALSLSTFIDVPWNGPWYARLGYEPYPSTEWGPEHRAIWQGQVESALDTTRRWMMIKRLPDLTRAKG
jgi:GNAT superfamily N-acetyltransferase